MATGAYEYSYSCMSIQCQFGASLQDGPGTDTDNGDLPEMDHERSASRHDPDRMSRYLLRTHDEKYLHPVPVSLYFSQVLLESLG